MSKTYTLAEILSDHMDAVREGRVKGPGLIEGSRYYLHVLDDGRIGMHNEKHPRCGDVHSLPGPEGYTIAEPKVVEVRRSLRGDVFYFPDHAALLAFVDAFDEWRIGTLVPDMAPVFAARDRFKVVD